MVFVFSELNIRSDEPLGSDEMCDVWIMSYGLNKSDRDGGRRTVSVGDENLPVGVQFIC